MSQFVDECRKEWKRLGVPEAVSNEMASDLAADLAEAQAEGVSPEEVLGNGIFDARSFAASWATARGLVSPRPGVLGSMRRPPWTVAVGVVASVFALAVGFVLLVGRQGSSVAEAAVRRSMNLPAPGLGGPRRFTFVGPPLPGQLMVQDSAIHALGFFLMAAGLLGLGLTLWIWKRRSAERQPPGFDEDVRLPSFL
jgi:hypothetical protein